MTEKLNLIGQRLGKLLVVAEAPSINGVSQWLCQCDCGKQVVRHRNSVRLKKTTSCGCAKKEPNAGHFKKTHGATPKGEISPAKRLYRIWSTIKQRTMNPKAHGFERYGAVGIKMCPEWENSFETFAADMGPPPTLKHTVDRIDPLAGYSKKNCRWATYTEQNRRRKNTIRVVYEGESFTLMEIAARHGVSYANLYSRHIKQGWSLERAIFTK